MTKEFLLQRVATNHNKLAQMIENGIDLKSGSNVILMAEVLSDLRMLAQDVQMWQKEDDIAKEQSDAK